MVKTFYTLGMKSPAVGLTTKVCCNNKFSQNNIPTPTPTPSNILLAEEYITEHNSLSGAPFSGYIFCNAFTNYEIYLLNQIF